MKKLTPTQSVIAKFSMAAILIVSVYMLVNKKETVYTPLETEIQKLSKKIDKQERMIHDMLVEIKMHGDTVYFYEQKKPIITNNYFENEKIILTASDSNNASMRFRNQLEFESRYFKGRYTPAK